MNINDIDKFKENLEKKTTKGFGYFMKNIAMVLLVFISIFILTNPTCITDPVEFFGTFKLDGLWVVFALFCSIAGFYQLAKSVQREDRASGKEQRIGEYEEAMTRKAEEVRKEHAQMSIKRLDNSALIDSELKSLLIKLEADRAAIVELHNGTNNASGFPFIYGDMAYEQISKDVNFAQDEFKNFNLAKLPFVALNYKKGTWIGSTDEVEKQDRYFAAKLRVVDANFGAFVVLEGINGPLGFLTLHYKDANVHPPKAEIIAALNHSVQIISTLLDRSRFDK